jgi:hypothetical protein
VIAPIEKTNLFENKSFSGDSVFPFKLINKYENRAQEKVAIDRYAK